MMYSWQIERWAGLCRIAVEETDKSKFYLEIREAFNAIFERLQSLHGLRKPKEELDAMKLALRQPRRRRRTLERSEGGVARAVGELTACKSKN